MDLSRVKYVITSPLSLGRVLWWYGEDELWPAALELLPLEVAGLAPDSPSCMPRRRSWSCCGRVRPPARAPPVWDRHRLHGRYASG